MLYLKGLSYLGFVFLHFVVFNPPIPETYMVLKKYTHLKLLPIWNSFWYKEWAEDPTWFFYEMKHVVVLFLLHFPMLFWNACFVLNFTI